MKLRNMKLSCVTLVKGFASVSLACLAAAGAQAQISVYDYPPGHPIWSCLARVAEEAATCTEQAGSDANKMSILDAYCGGAGNLGDDPQHQQEVRYCIAMRVYAEAQQCLATFYAEQNECASIYGLPPTPGPAPTTTAAPTGPSPTPTVPYGSGGILDPRATPEFTPIYPSYPGY